MSAYRVPRRTGIPAGGRYLLRRAALPAWGVAMVLAGSGLTIATGVLHLYLWGETNGYRQIPVIGPLFAVQAITSILLGAAALSRRPIAAVAAGSLMVATAAGLVLSIEVGLFGYRESWQAPWAVTSLIAELAAAALLSTGMLAGRAYSAGRKPEGEPSWPRA